MRGSGWNVDPVRILTRRELAAVLCDLLRRGATVASARLNRTILRLACCCGLRVSEIADLRLSDVHVEGGRPHLVVRPEGAKGGRSRRVPLWWDQGTLTDLAAWKGERQEHGAKNEDHFVCCLRPGRFGEGLIRHTIRETFPHRVQAAGVGAATNAHDPSRAAHVHQPCAGRRKDAGRGADRGGAHELADDERVSAHCGG